MTRAEAEAQVRQQLGGCLGPRDPAAMARWEQLMAAGEEEAARHVPTRVGCGYPFAETVIAHPFDGQDREVPCPRCGTITRYRAPVFPALEPPEHEA